MILIKLTCFGTKEPILINSRMINWFTAGDDGAGSFIGLEIKQELLKVTETPSEIIQLLQANKSGMSYLINDGQIVFGFDDDHRPTWFSHEDLNRIYGV